MAEKKKAAPKKANTVTVSQAPTRKKDKASRITSITFFKFREVVEDFYDKGMGPEDIQDSLQWFFNKSRTLIAPSSSADDMMREHQRRKANIQYGKMYCFYYDPKHKKTLPYYDKFPLIFPIDPKPGGFLGINLHYLPPAIRMGLMEALYDLEFTGKYNSNAKISLSYQLIKGASSLAVCKPCIKYYLRSHVRSPFLQIFYPEWIMAAALPVQQFEKSTARKVWADSRKRIGG